MAVVSVSWLVIVLLNSFAVFQVKYGDVAVTPLGVPSARVIVFYVESFHKSFADLDRIRGDPALYASDLVDQVVHRGSEGRNYVSIAWLPLK